MADYLKNISRSLINTTADLLANSDFINRSIGMSNSYEDIMFIVQALGREPISLLGKDYLYIFDHVRRNYNMGSNRMDMYHNTCPKFTFYKEKPTVKFANIYDDEDNLLDRWMPNVKFESTSSLMSGRGTLYSYAESSEDSVGKKEIDLRSDNDNANTGIFFGNIKSFSNALSTCDIIKKTNENFQNGKYDTLIARFHTKSMNSRNNYDITQTAFSEGYGMSHGRNLLSKVVTDSNGYDNPYCRVWTYHHQYNQLARAIRQFNVDTKEGLEQEELKGSGGKTVGFRTKETDGFEGGSKRLDRYGVLNYKNGMVNIAPTAKIKDYFEHKENKAISTKKCMFSIENLAWKSDNILHDEYDQMGLSPEQKGPLGGRIMWFPPYDLSFGETSNAHWNANQFIGRGEKIYTYTDTERSGRLSFTLLIDHPAILDYWTGQQRNGMKNGGKALIPNNAGGVDELDNQENTLLRFFAGCDVLTSGTDAKTLTALPQEFRKRVRKPLDTQPIKQNNVKDKAPETIVARNNGTKKIHCVLYFPNNYSGVDDSPTNTGSVVNAIYYLMNGIGAQKYINEDLKAEDLSTTLDKRYRGYEVSEPISVASENISSGYILSTLASVQNGYSYEYLTDKYGDKCTDDGTDDGKPLAKIVYSGATSIKEALKNPKLLNEKPFIWYYNRWYYRVDKEYEDDSLTHKESYLDSTCEQINSQGYEKLLDKKEIKEHFGLRDDDESTTLMSFLDLFIALEGKKARDILGGYISDEVMIKTVEEIMRPNSIYKVKSVRFEGHASQAGSNASNDILSMNRAKTFKNWMTSMGFPMADSALAEDNRNKKESIKNLGKNNELESKLWRSASVIIEYDESGYDYASVAEMPKYDENGNPQTYRGPVDNGQNSKSIDVPSNVGNTNNGNDSFTDLNQKSPLEQRFDIYYGIVGKLDGKDYSDPLSWDYVPNPYGSYPSGITSLQSGVVERYDNEGEFFKLLEKNDPFLHHLITDKIKYFDPAFHSISPEGFNARLTFLHQCTRQGSTVGASDNAPNTAYNLAFGRPPVCVLRLGDFYNTKIIINSVDINYESPQWDLNQEGIGVMPMFAKIQLNFVFLGGSDLAGPISRLQNAVSFNYYANTSVYDNRAEMVKYDENGKGHEVSYKPYSYPNMVEHYGNQGQRKAEVAVNEAIVSEFNGRTTNLNQGASGEKYVYNGN